MKQNQEEKHLLDKFEEEIKKEKEIVNLFNSLSEATFKGYYERLVIHEDEKLIIFELVSTCLHYLQETANESEDHYDSLLVIDVFKALFIDQNTFKKDALEEKKYCFNLVLKLLLNEELTDDDTKKITQKIKKPKIFDDLAKDYNNNYLYAYSLYLIFEYSGSKLFFLDAFISYMKEMFKCEKGTELEIEKDKNITEFELDKINEEDLLKSLHDIYYAEENFYTLYINANHQLKKKVTPPDKVANKIIENQKFALGSKSMEKKNKKVESNPGEIEIQKENDNQKVYVNKKVNEIQKENMIQKVNENKIAVKRVETLMIINKAETHEDSKIKNNNGITSQKHEQTETKPLNIDNPSKETITQAQYNQLASKIDELIFEIDVLKKKDRVHKKEMINIRNDFVKLEKESIKIKYELKLIKLRDIFKNIIDLFSKVYDIGQDEYYIDKIVKIKKKISNLWVKEDERLQLINFFDKIYFDFQFGNKSAHTIDFNESIIEQVFANIDIKNEFGIVKTKLKKGNMDKLLERFAFNRLNNFNNKAEFRKNEEAILNSVSKISEIYPNA